MVMWYSVLVNNSIVLFMYVQIFIGNYILRKIIYFVDSDVDKLSTSKEVACKTLVTLVQVSVKSRQYHQIRDLNVSVVF